MTPPSICSTNGDEDAGLSASMFKRKPYKFATLCTTVESPDVSHKDQYGSSSVPIYQTATFKGMNGQYDYSRSGNPTRSHLEHHIAKISSAQHAFAVTSGMAALDVIFRLLKPGDEIIAGNDLYGGSNRLLTYLKTHNGIITHHVSTTEPETLLPFLARPESNVTMVLLETPTNPLLQIADIAAIAAMVHQHRPDALVVVDNTMMSPYLQRPLEHGADLVYDSGTKYLSGHHDLMAGMISCNREEIAKQIAFTINSIGNALPAFDAFLLLRGVKTLALRLDRQQATTHLIANYLNDLGFPVNYPGLPNHPGKEIHDRLASGAGAVLSFSTGDKSLSEEIVAKARLWGISVSFGCVNSLISMPCLMSHASIAPALRKARNLPEDLIRLCIGIEDPEDLLDDLESALLEAGAIRVMDEAGAGGKRMLERVYPATLTDDEIQNAGSCLVVSAPGKVILFGEHAVVHGITAIAGSLSLRCYCLVQTLPLDSSSPSSATVTLSLPELSFTHSWPIDSLPWEVLPSTPSVKAPREDSVPDGELLKRLTESVPPNVVAESTKVAVKTFLYLYMQMSGSIRPAQSFVVRSSIPIGAGLGSSAAFSVAVVSALLYSHSHLPYLSSATSQSPKTKREQSDLVNAWAFMGEKIIHGTPSGVDNTVSSLGGAIAFRKAVKGRAGGLEILQGFKSIRFLLTDSRVPRDTKTLVAGVARRKLEEPDVINSILTSISRISSHAQLTLTSSTLSRASLIAELEILMEENHGHLVSLGVGHEVLERIREKTKKSGLITKLTGAGGGGCAVTIIPDEYSSEKLELLKAELKASGYIAYETTVGGPGFGLHTPSISGELEKDFRASNTSGLEEWASSVGEWQFV